MMAAAGLFHYGMHNFTTSTVYFEYKGSKKVVLWVCDIILIKSYFRKFYIMKCLENNAIRLAFLSTIKEGDEM